ncbi:MAG: DUF3147 family protein [Acidimicrobiales bacterium]
MHDVLIILVKAVGAGALVVISALIGEVLKPKRFAGLFSAAPSVAVASLAIDAGFVGTGKTHASAETMILGGAAMLLAILAGLPAIRRLRAFRAAGAIAGIWIAVATAAYVVFVL